MHRHKFIEENNYLICDCGRKKLVLRPTKREGISVGIRSDGSKYRVRADRHRYFFPEEWNKFIKLIKKRKHYIFFLTLLHTGARTMEALHLKPNNFNIERGTVTLAVVKQRKAKRQFSSIGKTRTFFVSDKYLKEIKRYIKKKNIKENEFIFLDNRGFPSDYEQLDNKDKKKYFIKTQIAYARMFKRKLKKAEIKDWYNFSLHNIRKTYGNWMRIYDIRTEEICYRMGHDMETYFNHYGSSIIFTPEERLEIRKIMGNVK